jgi:TonB family protein
MSQKVYKAFIKNHIDYPNISLKQKQQGVVTIEFNADLEGNITNYSISNSVSKELDSAAISIFKLILWKPATSIGKPIAGTSEFQIKYNIKSFNKNAKKRGYFHIPAPTYGSDTSLKIYQFKQLDTFPKVILTSNASSIQQYIYNNLTYPDAASKLALSGAVEISFIIETNGLPSNITPISYLGGGCTEEAIRIIESINWQPGILKNKSVRSYHTITISFQKNENRDGHIPNQQGSGI